MNQLDFRRESDLLKAIEQGARSAINRMTDATAQHLQDETITRVYHNVPSIYQRTYQFADSIDTEFRYSPQNDRFRGRVFFNTDQMNVDRGTYVKRSSNGRGRRVTYGIHADSRGRDVRRYLVRWIEEGHRSSKPKAYSPSNRVVGYHSYPARRGSHMLRHTSAWLQRFIPKALRDTFGNSSGNGVWLVGK